MQPVSNNAIKKEREYILEIQPPFPRNMLVEGSNICNNECIFCGHHKMKRMQGNCDTNVMLNILNQAYDAGTREVGFYMQGEPLLNNELEIYISFCKRIGFEYIYITTNGVYATADKIEKLCKAGLSSIKFSINSATKETYKKIHGRDNFDIVIKNFYEIINKKRKGKIDIPIFASYVVVRENETEIDEFKKIIGAYCDDVDIVYAKNQAGNMPELESGMDIPCIQLFNRLHITKEGYLNACCSDIDNMLAVADLQELTLQEAWNSDLMIEIRRQHLEGKIGNNICYNCIYGRYDREILPLNKGLYMKSIPSRKE